MLTRLLPIRVGSFVFLLLCISGVSSTVRGVRKSEVNQYTQEPFRCKDGSKTIPLSRVNDDYCDCENDGSDEPGTPACLKGKFFCRNKGFESLTISSARVNDGFCDCCDGSDEFATGKCADNCSELGKASQTGSLEDLRKAEEGAAVRDQWVAEGKVVREQRLANAARLREQVATKTTERDQARARKEQEEELENQERTRLAALEALDTAASVPNETVAAAQPEAAEREPIALAIAVDHPQQQENFPYPAEYMYKEKESQPEEQKDSTNNFPYPAEYAAPTEQAPHKQQTLLQQKQQSIYTADHIQRDDIDELDSDRYRVLHKQAAASGTDAAPVTTAEEGGEDEYEYEDDDSETTDSKYHSPAAEAARKVYTDLEKEVSELNKQFQEAEKLANLDSGADGEFAIMHGKCYSISIRQYEYEVCPFDKANQKEGHSATSLGTWDGWTPDRQMKFSNGVRCWQGPDRSLTVTLLCGLDTKILSVEEPSRCVYAMAMTTPAMCTHQHVQALRLEVEAASRGSEEE